jgi:hypothetical protein
MRKYYVKFRDPKRNTTFTKKIETHSNKKNIPNIYQRLGLEVISIKEAKQKKKKRSFIRRLMSAVLWFIDDLFSN